MSHPGYLPDCHVNIHASCVLLKVTFFQMSSERVCGGGGGGGGETQAYKIAAWMSELSSSQHKLLCSNVIPLFISQNAF